MMITTTMTTTLTMMMIILATTMVVVNGFTTPNPIAASASATRNPPYPTTTTSLDIFGRKNGADDKSASSSKSSASSSSSTVLEDGLAAYPFGFLEENPKAMVSRKQATKAFNELARLYGDTNAVTIVKIQPRSLVFDSDSFGPCLEAWTEQFGLEAAQQMVCRNPGLLAVRPASASEPAEDAMFFSYLIGITRPLPKIIGAGLVLSIVTAGLH